MKDYFEWNGVKSTVYGVHVTDQPAIVRASERATFTSVPARSGTLTTMEAEDVYDDFILSVACCVRDLTQLHEIGSWLRGQGTLALAEQPGGHYDARVVNQIEFAKILRNHPNRTFTVAFRCHPFWMADGVEDIRLIASLSSLTNPGSVYSEPVITITGFGDITLMIGQQIVELTGVDGSITLDTPLMEAYKGSESQNSKMSGDFPTLPPGATAVSWSGNVTRVTIQPNWRYLL